VQKYDARVMVVMRRRIPIDTPTPYPKPPIRPVEKIPVVVSLESSDELLVLIDGFLLLDCFLFFSFTLFTLAKKEKDALLATALLIFC
jgi:hypothetical protein